MNEQHNPPPIKAIIGLGNPGPAYERNRHNIGFKVLDALADSAGASWKKSELFESCKVELAGRQILLIKPLTFMNSSGKVMPYLQKQGIKIDEVLVVHDELELPFGQVKYKFGGSAKGHNGLKSIIAHAGDSFGRIRVGVGRPENRDSVPDYVLSNFSEPKDQVSALIDAGVQVVEQHLEFNPITL